VNGNLLLDGQAEMNRSFAALPQPLSTTTRSAHQSATNAVKDFTLADSWPALAADDLESSTPVPKAHDARQR
jgi:hypothetical protein